MDYFRTKLQNAYDPRLDDFFETYDRTILTQLAPPTLKALEAAAAKAKRTEDDDLTLYAATRIIEFRKPPKSKPRKTSEEIAQQKASNFSVALTGARPGDLLRGYGAAKGALIRIASGIVHPQYSVLEQVRGGSKSVWDRFLVKLSAQSHFAERSPEEISAYLYANASYQDNGIGAAGNVTFEILSPGTGKLLDVDYASVMGREVTGAEVLALYPKKSLVLLKTMWGRTSLVDQVPSYDGPVVDFVLGRVRNVQAEAAVSIRQGLSNKDDLHCVVSPEAGVSSADVRALYQEFGMTPAALEVIRRDCKLLTPAGYKSLMQKCIRYPAPQMELLRGEFVRTRDVLLVALGDLLLLPGAFVPNIQRYVTGAESALKRLAVSVVEDASVEDPAYIVVLLAAALYANRSRGWRPPLEMCRRMFQVAIEAHESHRVYQYRDKVPREAYGKHQRLFSWSFHILTTLRSFEGDLAMFKTLSVNGGALMPERYPETMGNQIVSFLHCVDHHWCPNFAYFFEIDYVRQHPSPKASAPFQNLFVHVWQATSSVNPRYRGEVLDRDLIAPIRDAQRRYMESRRHEDAHTEFRDVQPKTLTMVLESEWIAAAIGPFKAGELKKRTVLATVQPGTDKVTVFFKPSRDANVPTMSPQEQAKMEVEAHKVLSAGVPMRAASLLVQWFRGCKLVFTADADESWHVLYGDGQLVPWSQARVVRSIVPVIKPIQTPTLGAPIAVCKKKTIARAVSTFSPRVCRRILAMIRAGELSVPSIGRDGNGAAETVQLEDMNLFNALHTLSRVAPAAVRPMESTVRWSVPNALALWWVGDIIEAAITQEPMDQQDSIQHWRLGAPSGRELWEHQVKCVTQMDDRADESGHFLWLKVGSGKTLIVLTWLRHILETNPAHYIVWAMPKAAIESVRREILVEGFRVVLVDPTKKKTPDGWRRSSGKPVAHAINIIEHDHIRRVRTEFAEEAHRMIVVVDEVHKCLNASLRTDATLEICKLSHRFVALTGTPVLNNDMKQLVWWLSQVVQFEVNVKNFWVAVNSMVTHMFDSRIKVVEKRVEAQMSTVERAGYTTLVPESLGGSNIAPTPDEWRRASEVCYDACDRTIVAQTLKYLDCGVMVVARSNRHAEHLVGLLSAHMPVRQIYNIANGPLSMTREDVESGKTPDYRVVVAPIRHSEGYTLTHLSVQISSVYPSNNATREQIRGRINRIGQQSPSVLYVTVHTGILTRILENHTSARNIQAALEKVAASS